MEFFWKVLGPYFFVRFMLMPLPCQFFGPMEFFWKVLGPYFFVRFMLTPLPFLAFDVAVGGNGVYAKTAMYSLVFAEILTNIHSFIIIATNHAGDDLYRFNCHCTPRP